MYKYILFDLDGTLIDTNELILKSFKHTYKTHLEREISETEILESFGEPLIVTLERYSLDNSKAMFKTFIDHNKVFHDEYIKLFPGVKECLEELKSMGCLIAFVTSKRRSMAEHGLEFFDILKYFDETIALDDTTVHKPHPEPILLALEKLNCIDKKDQVLMVGDSKFDIMCASNAGIKSVLVNWSLASTVQKDQEITPDFIIDDLEKLINIVKGEINV